jgi:hypothetical protein
LSGEQYSVSDYPNAEFETYTAPESEVADVIASLTLENGVETRWYEYDGLKCCAFRKPGGEWTRFLMEEALHYPREQYGIETYGELFGQSGFCIVAPRGAGYTARDYYYFDDTGELRLLYPSVYLDYIADFDGDGASELLWVYYQGDGGDIRYVYQRGGVIYTMFVMDELKTLKPDWSSIAGDESMIAEIMSGDVGFTDHGLPITYLSDGVERSAMITFTCDSAVVTPAL